MANMSLTKVDQEAFENGRARVPVCLCIDVSASMDQIVEGETQDTGRREFLDGVEWKIVTGGISRKKKLIEALADFKEMLMENAVSKESVDLCIVTFSDFANVFMDFTPIASVDMPQNLETADYTDLGAGLKLSLDELNARKNLYKAQAVEYYQPILVVMSDGAANGNEALFEEVCAQIHKQESERRLSVFSIVLDDKSAKSSLEKISSRPPLGLKSSNFKEFFNWLSQSIDRVSSSTPGNVVKLAPPTFQASWDEL